MTKMMTHLMNPSMPKNQAKQGRIEQPLVHTSSTWWLRWDAICDTPDKDKCVSPCHGMLLVSVEIW
jgi:hypothetical protein